MGEFVAHIAAIILVCVSSRCLGDVSQYDRLGHGAETRLQGLLCGNEVGLGGANRLHSSTKFLCGESREHAELGASMHSFQCRLSTLNQD